MSTKVPTRTVEFGAGRTENLVMKTRPEVKKFLDDVFMATGESRTSQIERLVLEEMARVQGTQD